MAQLQANRTLSGSFASVWVDGALIAELESITVKVKLQRERVQLGMDVDSKITGYSGEGTMKLKQVYTRFYEVLDEARRGVDKRCTITTALKDPDSVDGQEERYAIAGVAFTELPFINYKIGEVNGQSLPFTFRPSELKSLDVMCGGGGAHRPRTRDGRGRYAGDGDGRGAARPRAGTAHARRGRRPRGVLCRLP